MVKDRYPGAVVKGSDLFDASLFKNPITTKLFYTFMSQLKQVFMFNIRLLIKLIQQILIFLLIHWRKRENLFKCNNEGQMLYAECGSIRGACGDEVRWGQTANRSASR